jgi:hypothetical protein
MALVCIIFPLRHCRYAIRHFGFRQILTTADSGTAGTSDRLSQNPGHIRRIRYTAEHRLRPTEAPPGAMGPQSNPGNPMVWQQFHHDVAMAIFAMAQTGPSDCRNGYIDSDGQSDTNAQH